MSKVPVFASASLASSIVELYINQSTCDYKLWSKYRNMEECRAVQIFGCEYGMHATIIHYSEWRQPHLSFNASRFGHRWSLGSIKQCANKNLRRNTGRGGVSWWRAAAVTEMGSAVGSGRVFHRDGVIVRGMADTPVILDNYSHHNILGIILLVVLM